MKSSKKEKKIRKSIKSRLKLHEYVRVNEIFKSQTSKFYCILIFFKVFNIMIVFFPKAT